MARPIKLTFELLQQLDYLLGLGCTIEVACDQVGIDRKTFYNWKMESLRLRDIADAHPFALATEKDVLFLVFFPVILHAQSHAHVNAVKAVHTGLVEERYTEEEPYIHVETRFRKGKDGEEIPYRHEETRFRTVLHITPPDWRAGFEFLKRRASADWNPPTKVEITWQDQAVADIQRGLIAFEDLAEWFDESLAAELFTRAGIPVPVRPGQTRGSPE